MLRARATALSHARRKWTLMLFLSYALNCMLPAVLQGLALAGAGRLERASATTVLSPSSGDRRGLMRCTKENNTF